MSRDRLITRWIVGLPLALVASVVALMPAGASAAAIDLGQTGVGGAAVASAVVSPTEQVTAPVAKQVVAPIKQETAPVKAASAPVKQLAARVKQVAAPVTPRLVQTVDQTTVTAVKQVTAVVKQASTEVVALPAVKRVSEVVSKTTAAATRVVDVASAKVDHTVDATSGVAAAVGVQAPGVRVVSGLTTSLAELSPAGNALGDLPVVGAFLFDRGVSLLPAPVGAASYFAEIASGLTSSTSGAGVSSVSSSIVVVVVGLAGSVSSAVASGLGGALGGAGFATLVFFSLAVVVGGYRLLTGGAWVPSVSFVSLSERPG